MISQERLKIDIMLLLSAHMPRRLAQQRMTLSDLEWSFHASRAISAVAELLVFIDDVIYFLRDISIKRVPTTISERYSQVVS